MDPAASTPDEAQSDGAGGAVRAALLYTLLGAVLLWPALASGERLGGKDWNAFLGQAQAEAETLLQWGEFPAWNPWRRGGQVSFAQPESMLLTPVTPLVLLVGAPLAFKLLLLPLFVACALGVRALARDLGLRGSAALLPGAIFLCASPLPLYVNGGLPNWLFGMAILPWLLLASRRATASRAWLVGGAALFALILFAGSVHHFVFFPLLLAVEAFARALRERSVRPLLRSAALGIVGTALALVRLVPLLELFSEFPRRLDASGRFMPPELMLRSLLLPHPPEAVDGLHVSVQGGSVLYWVDCGAFVGPVVLLLAALTLFVAWRRAWPFVVLAAAFAWLAAGSSVQPSLWDALHRLPVYASMQAPERFMGYVVFALALLAGFGAAAVQQFVARHAPGPARWFGAALLIVVAGPLLWFDAEIARGAFPIEPPADVAPTTWRGEPEPRPPFTQGRYADLAQQWGGPLFEAPLRNRGNVDGQSDVPSLRAAKAVGDLDYRGEVFLAGGQGTVAAVAFTPNRVTVTATLTAPDRLVINQNFFPGWQEVGTGRACVAEQGLIALPLATGEQRVELEFAPRSIPAAAGLGGAALLVLLAWAIGLRRRRGAAASVPAAVPPRALVFSWERYAAQRGLPPPLRWLPVDFIAVAAQALLVAGVFAWYATRAPGGAAPPPPPWRATAIAVAAPLDGDAAAAAELQRVLDAATAGAVIRLAPGDYERATIRRGITLVADPLGGARVRHLAIEDVAAGERVIVLGVVLGRDGVALPDPALPPVERGTLRIERCAGSVVVQGLGVPDGRAVAERPLEPTWPLGEKTAHQQVVGGVPPAATLRACAQVVLLDTMVASAEVVDSTLVAARLRIGEWYGDGGGLVVERSSVVLNDGACGPVELRDGGRVHRTGSRDLGAKRADPPAPLALRLTRTLGDGRSARLALRGPPYAKGTLIIARDFELVALKGRNAGQLRAPRFDGREILFPFELPASGEQWIPVVPAGDDARPGDGWFFQAFLKDEDGGLLYSAMDGGLLDPPPPAGD